MRKAINLMGKKFGRLTVIRRAGSCKHRNALWLCKCDCGTEKVIRGERLRNDNTKSCGCLKKELDRLLVSGLANMRKLIRGYKRIARNRGLNYELTEEQFAKITKMDCHYCGVKPSNLAKYPGHFGEYIYNGIDRVDNNKGYMISNIVPCCKTCNSAKNNHTLEEFKDWIKRLSNKMLSI